MTRPSVILATAASFAMLSKNALAFTRPFVSNRIVSSARKASSASLQMSDQAPLRLGIFGGGTVGGGVVDILQSKAAHIQALTSGKPIEVHKICVRDASKARDFEIPSYCKVVTDYDDILNDENIDIVVEVMGGTTDAKDVVFTALRKGKDVVTANKALIAACLPEIESILEETNADREDKVEFRYEAAVCGGIPIIRSMQSDFVGDDVAMISGIINGCTNYMLTEMEFKGESYDDALAKASELGYAEADPTLDVGGFDARSKLKILMRLAYGIDVDEEEISCRGITELTKVDFEYAKMLGGTIKLLGVAKKIGDDKVMAFVSPTYMSSDETLASVHGATNALEVISKNLESSTYIGQGAGRFPTANSCINDIVSLGKGDKTSLPFNPKGSIQYTNDFESNFYIRLSYTDALGITRQCGEVCEKYGISIHSLLQNPVKNKDDSAFAIITEKVTLSNVKKACAELEGLDWCYGSAFYMPLLRDDAV